MLGLQLSEEEKAFEAGDQHTATIGSKSLKFHQTWDVGSCSWGLAAADLGPGILEPP